MRFSTPLRYPGGKGKLSYYVKALIEENELLDGHYVEPFAGGAGVALELLYQEYVQHIHINDIDPAIFSFWYSCINNTEELCRLIYDTPVTIDVWKKQKEILKNFDGASGTVEQGFAAFFLNRTNRSGILQAGVIGGKDQQGEWKLDVRYKKSDLLKRIEKIARYSNRISAYNFDAVDFLKDASIRLPKKSLFYLDPPYYVKGQGLYRNFYVHEDHVRVKEELERSQSLSWIVSYDNAPQISDIYNKYRRKVFDLQYTAQVKKVGSEVMIFSDTLSMPEISLGKVAV